MANAGFTFTPKPQAALANLTPIKFGSALQFKADDPMKFLEQRPEIVMEGFLKGQQQMVEGISQGALSALGSVTGAYKDANAQKLADTKLVEQRQHEKDIANIRATASKDTQNDERYQSLRNQLQEKKIQEVENRLDSVVPTEKRSKGFFQNDIFETQNPDLQEEVSAPRREQSSLNLISPIPATASTEQPKIFSNINDISSVPLEAGGYSLADIRAPKTSDMVYPAADGQAVLNSQTLDLMQVSGAEGKPAPKPLAQTTPPEAVVESKKPSQYEVEQYYAGEPFESIADANYAKRQMIKYGYAAKVTATDDPTTKQRMYYVEFDEKTQQEPPPGTVLKESSRVDGKLTEKFEPVMKPEQKLPMIKGSEKQLDAMIKAVDDIKKLTGEGLLPEFGRASSLISKMPITTDASRVRALIKTIQANTAFKTIMDMRKASPTGAGLGGSTSDKDLELLVNTLGSLDPDNLDDPYITQNLESIKEGAVSARNDLELEKQGILAGNKAITPPTITNSSEYDSLPVGAMYYAKNKAGEVKLMQKTEKSKK
jgi:hypothetical protein